MRENLISKQYKSANSKGITLIALVVTIIVLLILAGVTIMLVFGENGIIAKAEKAKEETNQKTDDEQKKFENLMNKMNTALDGSGTGGDEGESIPEGTYSIPGVEPSPQDLFYYAPISTTTGKLASTEPSGLPEKKARITGMNEKYCNSAKSGETTYTYIDEDGNEVTVPDTNYEIIYNGTKISDTLVVPYKVKIGDEYYTVTEVNLQAEGDNGTSWPAVETIIYPNTVEIIHYNMYDNRNSSPPTLVVLPTNLKRAEDSAFNGLGNGSIVWIPERTEYLDPSVFSYYTFGWVLGFRGIIEFEGSKEQWDALTIDVHHHDDVTVEYNQPVPTTIPQSTETGIAE